MRWEHRGRQRLLDVEQRAESHEDRRPKAEFLRARAERDLEFGMAQIISLAPQRVVVNPILVGDERPVAGGVGGVRDPLPARTSEESRGGTESVRTGSYWWSR